MTEIKVLSEPTTYARDNFETSWFADLYRASKYRDEGAIARLGRSTQETLVDAEARGIHFRDVEGRAMSSSTGSGGDFLPPLYFGDLYAELPRQQRVVAGLVQNRPLPAKGTTITVPKVTGGASTAAQTADNQNTSNTDATTNIITIPVDTISGYVDVSRQILERAEPGLDEVLVQDLIMDYDKRLDNYLLNGTGSNGQPKGIIGGPVAFNAITWTSATPTVGGGYPAFADASRQAAEAVFEWPTAWVMTARRWAWFIDTLDNSNRPLIPPEDDEWSGILRELILTTGKSGPNGNASANIKPVGRLMGIPVYIDENIVKNSGAGTNQDTVLCAVWNKHILWEDPNGPRNFTFPDFTGNAQGEIRVQCLGYAAFTAERYPTATSVVTGTGLKAPTFVGT